MNKPISDLSTLLASAKPNLLDGELVFATLPHSANASALEPACIFREKEGISIICNRARAGAAGFPNAPVFRQITLTVHSSLDAVGFLAAITRALADAGIPCNAVSAFYHDHLFVPASLAEKALGVLTQLSAKHK